VFLSLLKNKPILDEDSVEWQFELYAWALKNFDAQVFYDETVLVVPSNEFFPGRENSIEGMAGMIFEKVKEYAGLKHWPCKLVPANSSCQTGTPKIMLQGAIRGSGGIMVSDVADENKLPISYDPRQVTNPEAIIATFAHTLAHYLGTMAQEMPPGGEENWPHVTEILGVFMGFGLIFANSAFVYRNITCGSCQPRKVERTSYLSQYDITYALAIFSVIKDIPNRQVLKHLKKSLRPYYKKAVRDVVKRSGQLNQLKNIKSLESA
jgi:hypothetical protein